MPAQLATRLQVEPMRLALITPGFSANESDWSIPALLDLVRALAVTHDVHVFTLRYPHARGRYRVAGATVHALGYGARGRAWRAALLADALAAIGREHRHRPFDLLHGLWADEPGFLAVTAGRLLQRPAMVSLMGGELVALADIGYGGQLSRANRRLTAAALRRADRVTAGSQGLARLAAGSVSDQRLAVLPLGVDTVRFRQTLGVSPDGERSAISPQAQHGTAAIRENRKGLRLRGRPAVLHVASLLPVKDQATLLRAVALAAADLPALHLHVVGDGPLRPQLEQLAALLGLADRATFHGRVSHDRLPVLYGRADLLTLSSRYESQNMTVLEAGACGCTSVGTAVGLLPELLPPDQVVPVGDHGRLGAAIVRLAQQPDRLAALGQAAQERVAAHYSLAQTIPALEETYRTLTMQT